MTEPAINPLMQRRAERAERQEFSPQAWCDQRNAGLDPAKGIEWYVDGGSLRLRNAGTGRQQFEPRCTGEEARAILRQHGLHGSAFAKSILASLGEYEQPDVKRDRAA